MVNQPLIYYFSGAGFLRDSKNMTDRYITYQDVNYAFQTDCLNNRECSFLGYRFNNKFTYKVISEKMSVCTARTREVVVRATRIILNRANAIAKDRLRQPFCRVKYHNFEKPIVISYEWFLQFAYACEKYSWSPYCNKIITKR